MEYSEEHSETHSCNKTLFLIQKLADTHTLSPDEYVFLIENYNQEAAGIAAREAVKLRRTIYGTSVFIRGLIEISNICKNDCLYCGIRKSNHHCQRYRLTKEQILECCKEGYHLGFRTFVLQGGEDPYFEDAFLTDLLLEIKETWPDCAITLSLGERSLSSYRNLFQAGADRYLLRHETACKSHYEKLHPDIMSYENRIQCLQHLKETGYQTGCGFMVGSPYQTPQALAMDLKFIQDFQPEMCGIGPFIPQKDTPLGDFSAGTLAQTCYLLSLIRLIKPNILLPATTALGSIHPKGRELGILSGANVVMPNLSPASVRKKYALYDNKLSDGAESAQCLDDLKKRMADIGYEIVTDRGDIRY